eukprot:CAMPEP_0176238042 /NCGR_PEP_ID=MMETSP0121_2-20121125/28161_1 /TAXON_ID=160619 /ORGANISM="Kryptoperidinium foliaceum, Strain CCMP 1326" /LENGTH=468 /DNA_ID=CAMNT_0017577505 /DNA_START=19 /DNA_END=1425 /DNA_ORIENTATION=+
MTSAMQMPRDVEVRIRALPGNSVCCDCSNVNPQWASVSYGALVCLECSGQHRSLGVHLSFVRSVQMDSWTERQISAMEKSGGNQRLVDFFRERGIEKNTRIATKYSSKQAAYYKERLTRLLDGKTEPPPDPGRYDPATGGSEAQGAEPLPGETTEQYNERQARLREEARERLRQKFGNQGLGSVGSEANSAGYPDGALGALGGAVGAVGGVVGSFAGGAFGFLKEKVVDNDSLHTSIRSSVGGAMDLTQSVVGTVRQSIAEGDLMGKVTRNVTLQEGTGASAAVGWTKGTVGTLWEKSSGIADLFGDEGGEGSSPQAPRCSKGHALRTEPRSEAKCTLCSAKGTRYGCSAGCAFDICTKCFEKPAARAQSSGSAKRDAFDFDDDSWGDDGPPKDPTKEDMERLAKDMGMKLTAAAPAASDAGRSASPPASSPMKTSSAASMDSSSPSPKKEKKKALESADDFFADFGM